MRGRKRDVRERAQAVGIALATGNASEAARQTGIPERTVQDWVDSDEFAELRARTKEQVAEEWWAGVQHGFRIVIQEFDGPAPLIQKATAAAVLFDKLALTRGEPTSRSETRDLTGALDDHELATLKAIVQGGHPADDPAEVAVVDSGANGTAPTG